MRYRFAAGDVVRVVSPDSEGVGREGVVRGGEAPGPDGCHHVTVWIDGELWMFAEDELEFAGAPLVGLERIAKAEPGPGRELVDTIGGRLRLDRTDPLEAMTDAAAAVTALVQLVQLRKLEVTVSPHWHEPFEYDLDLRAEMLAPAETALDALVRLVPRVDRVDDGWHVHVSWVREAGGSFLHPAVAWANIVASPWASRLCARGRAS
jgi:hypothetical protein